MENDSLKKKKQKKKQLILTRPLKAWKKKKLTLIWCINNAYTFTSDFKNSFSSITTTTTNNKKEATTEKATSINNSEHFFNFFASKTSNWISIVFELSKFQVGGERLVFTSDLRRLPRVLRPRATWAQVWREILNPREVHAKKKNKDGFPFR